MGGNKMIKMQAKFRVFEVAEIKGAQGEIYSQRVRLSAVYGNTEENRKWAKATPSGTLDITIDNPGAFNILKYGDEVILNFDLIDASGIGKPSREGATV